MKKIFTIIAVCAAIIAIGGCSKSSGGTAAATSRSSADSGEWKWARKVTLVCPWGVGGGADGTLRPLAPLLQDILGVPVEIVNVEGAGGANGMNFAYKQPADGYTYVLGTQSIIMLDVQKILPFEYRKELKPVTKLVHSINIIISSKKAMAGKYSNFMEFIDYAKNHPLELSCGMLSATGSDSVALKQTLAAGLGVSIPDVDKYVKTVSYGSGSELSAAMVGGHLTLGISGADEVKGLLDSGDIVPLISMSEKRLSALPDLPCTKELNLDSFVGTWRGLYCRVKTPDAAVAAMTAAVEKAWNMPAYQDFLRNASYLDRPGFANSTETAKLMDEEYTLFTNYLKAAGLIR
jgi:tripartite-type tricarboxylate transporter receptor subunit TctC